MAIKLIESFDGIATIDQLTDGRNNDGAPTRPKWACHLTAGTTWAIDASGRTGQCIKKISEGGSELRTHQLGLGTTAYVGFAYRPADATPASSAVIMRLYDQQASPAAVLTLTKLTSGALQLSTVGSLAAVSTPAAFLADNTWYYLEIKYVLSDTVGVMELRVNGVTILTSPLGDSKGASNTSIERLSFGDTSGLSSVSVVNDRYDDVYVDDSQYRGVSRVDCLRPTGNGNSSQGVGSDADSTDNYQLVDEQSVNDADYIQFSADDEKDTYAHGDLPVATGYAVQAVQVTVRAANLTAGKDLAVVNRESATEQDSTDVTLTSTLTSWFAIFAQAPGAVPWTAALVDSSEFGYKQRA